MIALLAGVLVLAPCPATHERVPSRHPLAPGVCIRREVLCDRGCRERRRARRTLRSCRAGNMRACIRHAARRYHVSESWMRRVAWCESRMFPEAYNASSGASGLYQFIPSTWATTPYADKWIFSGLHSALAAAWMVSVGRSGEWACA